MQYHQDWLMRQIEQMVQAMSRFFFGRDIRTEQTQSQKWETLQGLLDKKDVCPAEDALLDGLESGEDGWMEAGLRFYDRINGLTDRELEQAHFSREEI